MARKRINVDEMLSRASRSVQERNRSILGDHLPRPSLANVEQHPVDVPAEADIGKASGPRVRITVRSFRSRLCDADGISVKAAIDGLVEAGVIPDDNADVVQSVTVEQVKVKRCDERTEIVIETECPRPRLGSMQHE